MQATPICSLSVTLEGTPETGIMGLILFLLPGLVSWRVLQRL